MTRKEKLLEKLENTSSDKSWTFEEVVRILSTLGFSLKRIHGSHHVFSNDEKEKDICIPRHGSNVKPAYIREIRERLLK
jgi:predicted RNA binding protein YcfA (HicA-like mRNA interferase family)